MNVSQNVFVPICCFAAVLSTVFIGQIIEAGRQSSSGTVAEPSAALTDAISSPLVPIDTAPLKRAFANKAQQDVLTIFADAINAAGYNCPNARSKYQLDEENYRGTPYTVFCDNDFIYRVTVQRRGTFLVSKF